MRYELAQNLEAVLLDFWGFQTFSRKSSQALRVQPSRYEPLQGPSLPCQHLQQKNLRSEVCIPIERLSKWNLRRTLPVLLAMNGPGVLLLVMKHFGRQRY